jgi:hypothetical protein
MKKQLTIIAFSLFVITAGNTLSAQGKSGKKEEKQNQGQNKNDDKAVKKDQPGNSGQVKGNANNSHANKGQNQGNSGNNGNNGNNGNKGNGNNNDNINKGKNDNAGRGRNDEGYKWDRETFKDRKKIKNQEKVSICHKTGNNNEPGVSIRVSANAMKAHMNHGDVMGSCPAVKDNRFSNNFLERRTTYYTTLEDTREQVVYSRSILDYALERLAGSRQQLVILQANKAPAADIQRKQVVVTELEQNVSLLETLVGAAANLLVNKLQN